MEERRAIPVGLVRAVQCPDCKAVFRCRVGTRWYWREVRRTFGYPRLQCVACLRAAELVRQHGGVLADYRSAEVEPH